MSRLHPEYAHGPYTPGMALWPSDVAAEAFCYLTTSGRRSGRPHTVEMWFALHQERVYLLSGGGDRADWVQNLRVQPAVSVRIGAETHQGTARVLEAGTSEDALARLLLVEKYEPVDGPLEDWGRDSLPVAVTFEGLGEDGSRDG